MSEFIPKMIGLQNVEDYQKIKSLYNELISRAQGFIWDTQDLLSDQELKPEMIFELLKKTKPDLILFLKREYVKVNNISMPGINTEKLISLDLIDLPKDYDRIVSNWKETNELIDKIAATRFYFPLRSLINPENYQFELNEEFEESLLKFTAKFTETEKQNEVLKVIENFCNSINGLIELKLVKQEGNQWTNVCNILEMGIAHNKFSMSPLSPAKEIFNRHYPLERFGNFIPFDPQRQSRAAIIS
ncbi:MAG TPA: hypothetical protein VFC67_22125 [Prolixibacteraceae bacterium]|nr:hypothetical protein [Prolixibacteraceae bacterium]